MADKLKGLFGGGSDQPDDVKKSLADFSQKFVDTNGDGIPDDEVRANFQTVLKTATPEQIQHATAQTIEHLPEAQRNELAQLLKDRQSGQNLVDIQRTGETVPTTAVSGGGDDGGGLDDLLGGLLGGSGGSGGGGLADILGGLLGGSAPSSSGSSSGGGLDDLLGGLLGGGDSPSTSTNAQQGQGGGGLADLINGPLGKMIMGSIAAYATKEMLGK